MVRVDNSVASDSLVGSVGAPSTISVRFPRFSPRTHGETACFRRERMVHLNNLEWPAGESQSHVHASSLSANEGDGANRDLSLRFLCYLLFQNLPLPILKIPSLLLRRS